MSCTVLRVSLCIFAACVATVALAEERVQFNRDIRPLLSEKCFFCHGPDASHREADLRLDVESEAKAYAIDLEQPHESELVARITSDDADLRMPPPDSGEELTTEEMELLRRWIEQGAPYEDHWSFVPPRRPELPAVGDPSWVRNSIDRFVLARLDEGHAQPSPEADRYALIRRVTLDLTGLPPTVGEVEAFVADSSDDAYERVVDRLLQSRRYGEHMARYWLDAARYADTNGYQYDLEREQWVWRDWVIHAFNTNMPFDQFTVEQIAGDLLPDATDQQRLATAFHRNHPITIEGGVIDEEYRTEYVVDRLVTTSTVWLGLTMMCSRCHDHKYDPISQREFYQFYAFFNNVPERGLNGFDPKLDVPSPLRAAQEARSARQLKEAAERLDQLLAGERGDLAGWEHQVIEETRDRWEVVVPEVRRSRGGAELVVQSDHSILARGENPATEVYELILTADQPIHAIRLEALTHESFAGGGAGRAANANFVLSEFEVAAAASDASQDFMAAKIASADADYSQEGFAISAAIDGQIDSTGWAVDGNVKREHRTVTFVLAEPIRSDATAKVRIRMHFAYGGSHQIGRFRVALAPQPPVDLPAEIDAIANQDAALRSADAAAQLKEYLADRFGSPELRTAVAQVRSARAELAALRETPATMVMAEMETPRTTHVLLRGEYDQPGDEVQAGTPAALPPMPDGLPRNRLGLARWLVTRDHPLTARVAVNRFWQQIFGTGLVKTAEDFGAQGEWPSHPELLDWLAVEFVDSGWDVKALLKQIVMSATYRQSSTASPERLAQDPENRLLGRGPRNRLDAEVIRDSALAASGLLSDQIGGPSVFPYHPSGLWQEINNRPGYSRTYQQDSGDNLYRRSVYTFWKRTVPPPSMAVFDAPEREFCIIRRSRTNTPLQALALLHDPQYVEAARHLAGRMLSEGGATMEQRLSHGFQLCHARPPSDDELAVLSEIVASRLAQYRDDRDAAARLLEVGDSPRDASTDEAELAAWTAVGRVMLNLSEFVTKP